jgi:hypothetical protein
MSRLLLSAAALGLLMPAISLADNKPADPRKQYADLLPVSSYGESKPSFSNPSPRNPSQCKQCGGSSAPDAIYPPWMSHGSLGLHPDGYGAFGDELRAQLLWDYHECAPDGCIKPVGCGNFWTELKFIFGSCRQFHGTAESTVGHMRDTRYRWDSPYR